MSKPSVPTYFSLTLAVLFNSSPLIIAAAYVLTTDHSLRGWFAVMTSCAVLGVWATAMIGARKYGNP